MLDETTAQAPYQPTAEQWTAYRLQCWRDDNNLEQYQPARVEADYWDTAWRAMRAADEALKD